MRNERAEHSAFRPERVVLASSARALDLYQRDGFLFLDSLFASDEVETLRGAIASTLEGRSERTVLEVDPAMVRSVYGIHEHEPRFAALARHPRLIAAARQLLDGEVYVYQSKLNCKAVFGGDLWPWHQDFVFWQKEDGMPAPRALTAAVFLDDVTETNGPIALIPGSHTEGVLVHDTYGGPQPGYGSAPAWIANLTAKLKYTIEKDTFVRLATTNGIVTASGGAGSVLLFDCNTAHASSVNLSPYPRTLALFTYNRVDNAPAAERIHRPSFLVSRNTEPIVPVADDVLRPTLRLPA
jgi:L-proline 4-hydroxylase